MSADRNTVFKVWESFQAKAGSIVYPQTEEKHLRLLELMVEHTSRYDVSKESSSSLFGAIATYMHE